MSYQAKDTSVKPKKIILTVLFFIIAIGLSVAYFLYNKKHQDILDSESTKVNAKDLYQKYQSDTAGARQIYTDHILSVAGDVEKISFNQQHQQIVLIKTGVDGGYINCTLEGAMDSTKNAKTIHIKGICNGYIGGDLDMGLPGDVVLTRCYIDEK
ncbi:MAG: hypothetical protein RLY16_1188 [Bacteroidota bacterium]